MSETWKKTLKKELRGLENMVILGTGNALKADDAAGLLVASLIEHRLSRHQKSKIKVLRAYELIDTYLKKIKRARPSHLLVVDALDFKRKPGNILVTRIDPHKKRKKKLVSEFYQFLGKLSSESSCSLLFIGIQPESLDFGHPITPPVKEACRKLAEFLKSLVPKKP
jgi:hydrogenase 3 maturation protease